MQVYLFRKNWKELTKCDRFAGAEWLFCFDFFSLIPFAHVDHTMHKPPNCWKGCTKCSSNCKLWRPNETSLSFRMNRRQSWRSKRACKRRRKDLRREAMEPLTSSCHNTKKDNYLHAWIIIWIIGWLQESSSAERQKVLKQNIQYFDRRFSVSRNLS